VLSPNTLATAIASTDTAALFILPRPSGFYKHRESRYPAKADYESIPDVKITAWYKDNAGKITSQGKPVDIHPLGRWFDVNEHTNLADVIKAMQALEVILDTEFQPPSVHRGNADHYPVRLAPTPTMTGLDLMRRKLPFKASYDNLSSGIEKILMTEFSQARIEQFSGKGTIEELHLHDGRFCYAACTRNMPVGAPRRDTINRYEPWVPGVYRVRATVPSDWHHIGLLSVKNPTGKGSIYPNTPGQTFDSWCGYQTLKLALEKGWQCEIQERILWPDSVAKGFIGKDPLKGWTEKLVELREKYGNMPVVGGYLKCAFRQMHNNAIGGLHRGSQTKDVYHDSEDEYYDEFIEPPLHVYEDGSTHTTVKDDLTGWQLQTFLPHWALCVWDACQALVTRTALELPYESLLAIRTDGIFTTAAHTFPDNGKVGQFREKPLAKTGPFEWPEKGPNDLMKLIKEAKGE
jgi:hypothetical protein